MMPANVNNNPQNRAVAFIDKTAEKKAHDVVSKELRDLDYANKSLVKALISSYIKDDASFNVYKATFIRRLKFLLIRLRDPGASNETLHLVSQFILLDCVRRSVGIPLKDIRSVNNPFGNGIEVKRSTDICKDPLVISPSSLPKEFIKYLQVPSSSGINYLEYIKNNVSTVIFSNFAGTKELGKYGDIAGVSDPISRTALINSPTYDWSMASSLVHEAAHIEWDRSYDSGPANPAASCSAERYSYIMRYNFLNDLLSNLGAYKLEKDKKNIEGTMEEIKSEINMYNYSLGYKSDDLSVKISSK